MYYHCGPQINYREGRDRDLLRAERGYERESLRPKANPQAPLHSPKYRTIRNSGNFDDLDERIFEFNNYNTNFNFLRSRSPSFSPVRDSILTRKNYPNEHYQPTKDNANNLQLNPKYFADQYEPLDSPPSPDEILKLKWIDNSPRMTRLRDHRNKRLLNRLEVFLLII